MSQTKQVILGIVTLVLLALIFVFLGWCIWRFFSTIEQPFSLAIIAACTTFLASTVAVVIGKYYERKREAEIYFRKFKQEQFDEFLRMIFGMMSTGGDVPEASVEQLREWQRKLILFAGPQVILDFIAWRRELGGNLTVQSFLKMGRLFKSIRADLGISSRRLGDEQFAHLILRNADLFIDIALKNPNAPLSELIELEKTLGLNADQLPRSANSAPG